MNDSILFAIYIKALQNESTSPNYIVIYVEDLNTNSAKEICSSAPFLLGAIHREYGYKYDSIDIIKAYNVAKSNFLRNFKFKKIEALNNIGFDEYPDIDKVKHYTSNLNLGEYIEIHKNNDVNGQMYFDSEIEQLMFAHVMFNHGIMTGWADITGNLYFGDLEKILNKEPKNGGP